MDDICLEKSNSYFWANVCTHQPTRFSLRSVYTSTVLSRRGRGYLENILKGLDSVNNLTDATFIDRALFFYITNSSSLLHHSRTFDVIMLYLPSSYVGKGVINALISVLWFCSRLAIKLMGIACLWTYKLPRNGNKHRYSSESWFDDDRNRIYSFHVWKCKHCTYAVSYLSSKNKLTGSPSIIIAFL